MRRHDGWPGREIAGFAIQILPNPVTVTRVVLQQGALHSKHLILERRHGDGQMFSIHLQPPCATLKSICPLLLLLPTLTRRDPVPLEKLASFPIALVELQGTVGTARMVVVDATFTIRLWRSWGHSGG